MSLDVDRGLAPRALSIVITTIIFSVSDVSAQTAAETGSQASDLQEIVVTASKRGAQNVQDLAFSVQAIGKDRLAEEDILEFNDYFRKVPGLAVWEQGPGDQRFVIRGVNTKGAASVGVYFDEVVVTDENADNGGGRQGDVKLFDVDRVEVLRGPQGTTFGSSSMTGTIRVLPMMPALDKFSADVGVGTSSTSESGDLGWRADGFVNIPLITDRLAVRFSGLKLDRPGYIDSRFAKDDNDEDATAYRGILAWKLSDSLMLTMMAMRQEQATHGRPFYNFAEPNLPLNPAFNGEPVSGYVNRNLSRAGFDDAMNLYNVKLNWTQDWGSITATSSIYNRHSLFDRDSSVALEVLSAGALPANGGGRSIISQFKQRELFSNELRFASAWKGRFQLLAGVFYQEEDRTLDTEIFTTDPVTGTRASNFRVLFGRGADASIDELALFSELAFAATDKLTVTGGVRWADFDVLAQDSATVNFGGSPGPGAGPERPFSESKATFKGNVSYAFTPQYLAYAQVSEGFRSGGANNTAAGALVGVTIPDGFESDDLVNYEIGAKTSWLGGTLVLNGAGYFIDWSNIQTVQQARAPSGIQVPYQGNAGSAEIVGLELEMSARVLQGLDVSVGVNVNDAKFTEDFPVLADGRDGDKIPYVPDYTASLDVRYEWPIAFAGRSAFVGGDVTFTGKQGSEVNPTDLYYRDIDAYTLASLRTGLKGESWSATLALENAFDEKQPISYVFDFRSAAGPGLNPDGLVRPWPRTVSLTFRKSFGQ